MVRFFFSWPGQAARRLARARMCRRRGRGGVTLVAAPVREQRASGAAEGSAGGQRRVWEGRREGGKERGDKISERSARLGHVRGPAAAQPSAEGKGRTRAGRRGVTMPAGLAGIKAVVDACRAERLEDRVMALERQATSPIGPAPAANEAAGLVDALEKKLFSLDGVDPPQAEAELATFRRARKDAVKVRSPPVSPPSRRRFAASAPPLHQLTHTLRLPGSLREQALQGLIARVDAAAAPPKQAHRRQLDPPSRAPPGWMQF